MMFKAFLCGWPSLCLLRDGMIYRLFPHSTASWKNWEQLNGRLFMFDEKTGSGLYVVGRRVYRFQVMALAEHAKAVCDCIK